MCSDATPKHVSTGSGIIASPLFSAAVQTRLTACLCHCNHTYGDLLFIQVYSDATPMHCSTVRGSIAFPLFRAALQKQADSRHCATATTPLEICSSYRCAVMQHQSTSALVQAEQLFHCSVLQSKTGSQLALCLCNYTHVDLLFL